MSAPGSFVSGTPEQRWRERLALAIALGSVAFVVSYAGQRLTSLAVGEPDWNDVIRRAHTPYYWRCAMALVHAGIAGTLGVFLPPEPLVRPVLRFAPIWIIGTVMVLALVMVVFP